MLKENVPTATIMLESVNRDIYLLTAIVLTPGGGRIQVKL